MGPFLARFHIRDLEQFSGVKAHTIRVWERRYRLLQPGRTDTNIRTYDLDELKVILNVAYLNQRGHKISRIAAMSPAAREQLIRTAASEDRGPDRILNELVLAMLAFEEARFVHIIDAYERQHGFRPFVEQVLLPLLGRVGTLWQSSAVCPAQEHFVSNIIRQRLIVATAGHPAVAKSDTTYVLYLPEHEIHELGLLYVDHLLRSRGRRTIYLGQSVPQADLRELAAQCPGKLVFIGSCVVQPATDDALRYLRSLREELVEARISFLLAGAPLREVRGTHVPKGISVFRDLKELVAQIDSL